MRVVWISFVPPSTLDQPSSDIASLRSRITSPARAIAGSKLAYVGPGVNRRTLLEQFAEADAAVFGRLLDASMAQTVLELATEIGKRGVKVIVDYSEDYSAHPELASVYRSLIQTADVVAASNSALAGVLRSQTPVPVAVVGDPVEGERGEPRASSRRPPRLLWSGPAHTLAALRFALDQLTQRRAHFALSVLTSPGTGAENLGHRFRAWSTEALLEELYECDGVVLPGVPIRFCQAIWAGRFVIDRPSSAYGEVGPYGWLGDDVAEGVEWLLENPQLATERIRAGQEWVAAHASLEAIARAWKLVAAR